MDDVDDIGPAAFWGRLRRRKVVQWGVAYAASAWGLLQGIGFLADAFHWPDAVKQIATLALLLALPIALVLAWYHGDKGQQRVSGSELAILTALVLAGVGIFWWHHRAAYDTTSTQATAVKELADGSDAQSPFCPLRTAARSRTTRSSSTVSMTTS